MDNIKPETRLVNTELTIAEIMKIDRYADKLDMNRTQFQRLALRSAMAMISELGAKRYLNKIQSYNDDMPYNLKVGRGVDKNVLVRI